MNLKSRRLIAVLACRAEGSRLYGKPLQNLDPAKGVTILDQIISGIKEYYPDVRVLINKQVLYIVNLEPRKIKGYESNGMLMAVDGIDGKPVFLVPEVEVSPGTRTH